jgi:hypothetical protein
VISCGPMRVPGENATRPDSTGQPRFHDTVNEIEAEGWVPTLNLDTISRLAANPALAPASTNNGRCARSLEYVVYF